MFFFFHDPPPTEIYPLSLHDALPICPNHLCNETSLYRPQGHRQNRIYLSCLSGFVIHSRGAAARITKPDRKSTRLNSSHVSISYAVFCLKKKTTSQQSSTRLTRIAKH